MWPWAVPCSQPGELPGQFCNMTAGLEPEVQKFLRLSVETVGSELSCLMEPMERIRL